MNPHFEKINQSKGRDKLITGLLRITPYLLIALFVILMGRIILRGAPVLTSEGIHFFTNQTGKFYSFYDENQVYHRIPEEKFSDYKKSNPDDLYLALASTNHSGGISGALAGTLLLLLIAMLFAILIGLPTALFLSEYAGRSRLVSSIRIANTALAGIPPVVFGLFGLAFFCYFFPILSKTEPVSPAAFRWELPNCPNWLDGGGALYLSFQGWGLSLFAMGCTLACLALPIVILGCEEALREVPQRFRDAALSLGASRWHTIRQTVFRNALPGILGAIIFGMIRVTGATAPLLFTGAIIAGSTPTRDVTDQNLLWGIVNFLGRECEALSYYVYTLSTQTSQSEAVREMQDGAVLTLMVIVMFPVILLFLLRRKTSTHRTW